MQFSDTINRTSSFSFSFSDQIPSAWRPFGNAVLVWSVPGLSLPLKVFLVSLARIHTDLQDGLP